MTLLALALVLAAGSFHATWNLLAKRASSGVSGPAFVWLCTALSTLIFAPVAAIVLSENPHVGTLGLLFMFGTGILHTGYFLSLQEGYRVGDLSMIYPLARGTGPLLASAAAIALFDERPGPLGAAGILLIVSGVFLLAWEPDSGSRGSAKKKWLGMGLRSFDRRLHSFLYPLGQVRRQRPFALADPLLLGVLFGGSSPAHTASAARQRKGARCLACSLAGDSGRGRLKPPLLCARSHSAGLHSSEPSGPRPRD